VIAGPQEDTDITTAKKSQRNQNLHKTILSCIVVAQDIAEQNSGHMITLCHYGTTPIQ